MFNSCYFEYAGVYSGKYNLIICYVNRNESFVAGGAYEPITDLLPSVPENIIYGLDYSKKPLEFTIEIINPDNSIPISQEIILNDWLFGQNCWKTLKLKTPDYSNYHLKCLLIPESIIRDVTGIRGFRCKLKNISSFWYGNEVKYEFNKSDLIANGNVSNFTFNVNNKSGVDLPIYPIIQCKLETSSYDEPFPFYVENMTNDSLLDMVVSSNDDGIDTANILTSNLNTINTKFPYFFKDNPNTPLLKYKPHKTNNYDSMEKEILYLDKGINQIKIACHTTNNMSHYRYYDNFIFSFIPRYRIGGF